ncbi:unnamed protein product [Phaedon cochleariae]|uniref:RPA43 OB domain-containing protein n=1 Tax=Phaedon cochleariae TaxID=80249 RepID=A0A9N9SGL0_PHACE|nr:unnamed protein product [Phaedon cochleariae]
MGKFNVIKFDSKVLNALKDIPNSGVEAERKKQHLALHPIHLNDFGKSVKDLLNEDVARYSKDLDGILLGYEDIKLLSNGGFIQTDSCYIHIDIEAHFFVFRPKIGEEMKGIVTRKSKDHVGVLVYNTFNVSIPPGDEEEDHWIGLDVQVGYEVSFRIVFFTMTSFMPYIRGQLISITAENNSGLSKKNKRKANMKLSFSKDSDEIVEEFPKSKKSKKEKHKPMEEDDLSLELEVSLDQINSENLNSSQSILKRKSKKHKRKSSDTLSQDEYKIEIDADQEGLSRTGDSELSETRKKKRKRSLSVSETLYDEHEMEMKKQNRKRSISISGEN